MDLIDIQRIPFTKDADNKLRSMKATTGITPNILCRMGFCLSLEFSSPPRTTQILEKGREINRYTLLGKYDSLAQSLLAVWLDENGYKKDKANDFFIGHMNRGVDLIKQHIKTII